MKFRKKPVVIEAWRFTAASLTPWPPAVLVGCNKIRLRNVSERGGSCDVDQPHIHTLEGSMLVTDGDWIIKGVKGEFYPIKPDIFAATYEPAE